MFQIVLLNNQLASLISLSSKGFSKDEKFIGLQERGNGRVISGLAMDPLLQKQELKRNFYLFCVIFFFIYFYNSKIWISCFILNCFL